MNIVAAEDGDVDRDAAARSGAWSFSRVTSLNSSPRRRGGPLHPIRSSPSRDAYYS